MRLVVHKFGPFHPGDEFEIENFNRVVHFAEQTSNELMVWAEVFTERSGYSPARFTIYPTGKDYNRGLHHERTALTRFGYVWHLMRML